MGSLPHVIEDCHGVLQLYSDGSIFRSDEFNFNFPVHDDGSVLFKHILFDEYHSGLHLTLYKPKIPNSSSAAGKLPILFFFHGGGFCVGTRTWPNFHNCCLRLCLSLQALVVAPDYRLAPEHRLPAAMEDGFSALKWLQMQGQLGNSEPWLSKEEVDFDRVFIMGDSSGGNIAHHLAVKLRCDSPEMEPVRVRGYVLMAPFFGGSVRTKSEAEGPPEELLNLDILDRFWRISLPVGETADHPFANPFGPLSPNLEPVKLDPILVIVGGNEMLKDRAEDYTNRLKKLGKKIDYVEFEGKQHGFFTNHPYCDVAEKVIKIINNFMFVNSQ